MYQKSNLIILPGMKVSDIILSNPYFMLMLEYFEIDLVVHEKTIEQVCIDKDISTGLFLTFANLFNGNRPSSAAEYSFSDVKTIITFLRNSHHYYLEERLPKIRSYIKRMFEANDHPEILMVEQFFNEYSKEVTEHLDYENQVVFPYMINLFYQLKQMDTGKALNNFSAAEYQEHHDNIAEKLTDLKNLLIKYLPQKNDQKIRRKLLFSLFELEYDLNIHSLIEDSILIPLVEKMERHLILRK